MSSPEFQEYSASQRNQSQRQPVERRRPPAAPETELIYPSQEWSWMMGILAGGGKVYTNRGDIIVTSPDDNFLSAYKSLGERLFQTNATSSILRIQKDGREYKQLRFGAINITRQLGDLRRTEWYSTVLNNHKWILENPRYTWSFLEGFFEMRGGIIEPHEGIIFHSNYVTIGNAISELLARVGVNNPVVLRSNSSKEGVRGVGVFKREDVKLFARNIHSKIPAKEEALEALRRRYEEDRLTRRGGKTKVYSDEEIIGEWIVLRRRLGHVPNSYEIGQLKKQREAKISVTVFRNRFGDGKSFASTQEALERIALERGEPPLPLKRVPRRHSDETVTEVNINPGEEVQIFPAQN